MSEIKKTIAEQLIDVIPNMSAFSQITEDHLIVEDKNKEKTFLFNDLSILKIKEKDNKAFFSKTKNIKTINFEIIKIKKTFFYRKKT